jgi:hypothetical protein
MVEDWCASNNMLPLNNGTSTRVSRITGLWSTPDLSIAHMSQSHRYNWYTLNDLGADHLPIIIEVDREVNAVSKAKKTVPNWNKADWPKYNSIIDNMRQNDTRATSAHTMCKEITEALNTAAAQAVPKKVIRETEIVWMTDEIKLAIKERTSRRVYCSVSKGDPTCGR